MLAENLTDLCKRVEAFETPRWAIESVLEVELTTRFIIDPCAGLGAIGEVCRERLLEVEEWDIIDWYERMPERCRTSAPYFILGDFLADVQTIPLETTIVMNPPFSLAEDFVLKAQALGARKIICFQRQAWRESGDRREFWENNAPARTWVCGARANCWRFDLLQCQHEGGEGKCPNAKRRGKKVELPPGCNSCLGGSPTSHAWYVWERGHKGAEVTSAIYPRAKT